MMMPDSPRFLFPSRRRENTNRGQGLMMIRQRISMLASYFDQNSYQTRMACLFDERENDLCLTEIQFSATLLATFA